jgi:hypothetical protein
MRIVWWIAGVLLAVAILWTAWPVWSGWQLRQALRARDTAVLEARVDWPTLRANLKPRLVQAVRDDAQASTGVGGLLKRALGETLADRSVDYLVTPANLGRLLAGRAFVTERLKPDPAQLPRADIDPEDPEDPVPPRRVRWAFFASPTAFRIEAIHPRLPGQRVAGIFQLTGWSWKLVDVQLIPAQ